MKAIKLWRGAIVRFLDRATDPHVREGTVVLARGAGVLLEADGQRLRLLRTAVTKVVSRRATRKRRRRRRWIF